jgi:putative FmdB family regulatory protein
MPLYVYNCPECDIEIDELRPGAQADWPPVECPICHGLCRREISSFALQRGSARQEERHNVPVAQPAHPDDCACCRPTRRR